MIATEIVFPYPKKTNLTLSELEDEIISFMGCLQNNGNTCGDEVVFKLKSEFKIACYLASRNAYKTKYFSKWAIDALTKLQAIGINPEFKIIGKEKRRETWKNAKSLYLFSHAFNEVSPLCTGDTGEPVPLFLIPISDLQREHLHSWSKSYQQHDLIWLYSGSLEINAYKETADCNSDLSQRGREFCAEIEKACKLPTYYYLHRYWGRRDGEKTRLCPGCGENWSKESTGLLGRKGMSWFDFQCDTCRLVSHIGDDCSDERHARIGEWKSKIHP